MLHCATTNYIRSRFMILSDLIVSQITIKTCKFYFTTFSSYLEFVCVWVTRKLPRFNKSNQKKNLHFWYLNFIGIILPPEVVPWSRWACWCWIATDWCCRTILSAMNAHGSALYATHRNGNSIIDSHWLTELRVVKRLKRFSNYLILRMSFFGGAFMEATN